MNRNVLLLASGGIDSTACIHYYLDRSFSVQTLHINYGQVAFIGERAALQSICEFYGITYQSIRLDGIPWVTGESDEVVGRNLVFGSVAIASSTMSHGLLAMGIHSQSEYIDCCTEFQAQLSNITQLLSGYQLDFDFPFGLMNKAYIIQYCRKNGVPLRLTYSCTRSDLSPCGSCNSCLARIRYLDD